MSPWLVSWAQSVRPPLPWGGEVPSVEAVLGDHSESRAISSQPVTLSARLGQTRWWGTTGRSLVLAVWLRGPYSPSPFPVHHDGGPEPTGRGRGRARHLWLPQAGPLPTWYSAKTELAFLWERKWLPWGAVALILHLWDEKATAPVCSYRDAFVPRPGGASHSCLGTDGGQRGKRWNSGQPLLPGVELCPSDQQRSLIIKGPYATPK